jgi:hypothetical protein
VSSLALLASLTIFLAACASPRPATGRISGRVRWEGPVPERATIDLSKFPEMTQSLNSPLRDESIVVNEDGAVQAALVEIVGGERVAAPDSPARLVVRQGRFDPHLLVVQAGQPILLEVADLPITNMHFIGAENLEENYAVTRSSAKKIRFEHPEPRFVKVKSDLHPWMRAWIAVLDHRPFAVTGDDGAFAIEDVAPGRHALLLRHPMLGEQRVEVDVAPDKTTTQDFTLKK